MKSKLTTTLPKPIYIGAAIRSPIGKFGGSLKRFSAPELASLVLKEALVRAPEAPPPDFVILGHARSAGTGPNTARQTTIFSGLPESIPAFTVNQACASGLAAIICGIEKIATSRAHSVWAGGTESMSNTPYYLMGARWGYRMGTNEVVDGMTKDGFFCPMAKMVMGETVERFIASELGISRTDQDSYALLSQQRADRSWKQGLFNDETFEIPGNDKNPPFRQDENRRGNTTAQSLAKLPPVFDPTNGTVTAGNSSGITDGAAFVHLSDRKLPHMQAEVLDYESVALDPKRMGLGPVPAVRLLLERHKIEITDFEAIELNEAFAAQVLACQMGLKIPIERLNVRGGAIALGHPIGATGTRITVTLLHQLKGKSGALGLITLCVSGGQGVALLVRTV